MQLFPDLTAEPEAPATTEAPPPSEANRRAKAKAALATAGRERRVPRHKGKPHPWPRRRHREQLGLSPESYTEIDRELRRRGHKLLNRGKTIREAARALSMDAYGLCREHGCTLPERQLRLICQINRHFVRRLWPGPYLPKMLTDAKAWADRQPSIIRDWDSLAAPLEFVVSDVTPLDVRFLTTDGREQKLRLIATIDGKTRRLFVHVFAPERGAGVRMEHVAAHIAWFCLTVGGPKNWNVDRGGEFKPAEMIAHLTNVIVSKAYNARAKLIEPAFAVLLRFLEDIAGFIGSDRLRKKTQSVGRPAKPFPGSLDDLVEEVRLAIAHYNATPKDALGGLSPNQAWQAAMNAGWKPSRADPAELAESLCRREPRTVTRGSVKISNRSYYHDELARRGDLEGRKVTVALSLFGFPPLVYDEFGNFVCELWEDRAFHPLDRAGAEERERRQKLRNEGARAYLREHGLADLREYRERALEMSPAPDDSATAGVVSPWQPGLIEGKRRVPTMHTIADAPDDEDMDALAVLARNSVAEAEAKAAERQAEAAKEEERLRALAREMPQLRAGRTGS